MGFTNEYLTEEETELIKQTMLDSLCYVNRFKNVVKCNKRACTTDRERKIWFIRCVRRADFDPRLKEENFVMFYGKISTDNLVEICLKKMGEENDPAILEKYNASIIFYWAVKSIKIFPKLQIKEQEIRDMMEEIMTAYGICGDPEDKGPEFDGKIKAFMKEYTEG